jgi:hypothetical protein
LNAMTVKPMHDGSAMLADHDHSTSRLAVVFI